MLEMKQDSKVLRVLEIIGGIIVIWFALLITPILNDGLIYFIKEFPSVIKNPFRIEFVKESSIKTAFIFLVIYVLSIFVNKANGKNYRRREEYGSAKWGDLKELRKKYIQKSNRNILLTQNMALGLNARKHRRNLNVVVVGGSRKWKNKKLL